MEVDVLCESSDSAAGAVDLLCSSERQHWWESSATDHPPPPARPFSSKQVFLAAQREMKPGRPRRFTVATSVLNKIVSVPQTQNPAWSSTKMIAQSRKNRRTRMQLSREHSQHQIVSLLSEWFKEPLMWVTVGQRSAQSQHSPLFLSDTGLSGCLVYFLDPEPSQLTSIIKQLLSSPTQTHRASCVSVWTPVQIH